MNHDIISPPGPIVLTDPATIETMRQVFSGSDPIQGDLLVAREIAIQTQVIAAVGAQIATSLEGLVGAIHVIGRLMPRR